jgi:hypothetical protein
MPKQSHSFKTNSFTNMNDYSLIKNGTNHILKNNHKESSFIRGHCTVNNTLELERLTKMKNLNLTKLTIKNVEMRNLKNQINLSSFCNLSCVVIVESSMRLPIFHDNLHSLVITGGLIGITNLPINLIMMQVINCKIKTRGAIIFGDKLEELTLQKNNLEYLLSLPSSLKRLTICDNLINQLPKLPDDLIYLNCNNNKLVQLELPEKIQYVQCCNNDFNTLKLPSGIKQIKYSEDSVCLITDDNVNNNIVELDTDHIERMIDFLLED